MPGKAILATLSLLVSLFTSAGAIADPGLFLAAIKVERIDEEEGFEIRLFHRDYGELATHLASERSYVISERDEYVAITSRPYSFPRDADGIERGPTLVADYHRPEFEPIRGELIARYGVSPDEASLVAYVHEYIDNKNHTRGFDFASRVAETKEGDCTEHAVLLVALLRMFEIPARVVLGIKILEGDNQDQAFGHAWVEYIRHGAWKAADPALAVEVDGTYIPVGTLQREGLDFRLDIVSLVQRLPYRIEISAR